MAGATPVGRRRFPVKGRRKFRPRRGPFELVVIVRHFTSGGRNPRDDATSDVRTPDVWDPPDGHPQRRMFAGLAEYAFFSHLGVADPPLTA